MHAAATVSRAFAAARPGAQACPQASQASAGRSLAPPAPRRQRPASARQGPHAAAAAEPAAAAPAPSSGLSVREESLPNCGVRLHVEVPAQLCKAAYNKTLSELRKTSKVDGYRKGKAPDKVLVEALGGQERLLRSVLSEALEPWVAQAMRPYEGVCVPDSERLEQDADALQDAFSLDAGLSFSILFDAVPALQWKADYRTLQVAVESAGDEAGDVAAAEEKLLSLQKSRAKLRVVADRGLQRGDLAIVDFSASRADTGEELLGAERRSMRLDTDDADRTFLPGIVAVLEGMKAGEEREAPLTFPTDEAFQPATLRGVEARVKVKMTELFNYDMPEMNDEFAESLLPGCGGLDALRQRVVQAAAEERESIMKERTADAFMAAVGRAVEVEIPESLLIELGNQQYSVELNRLLAQGQLNWETAQQLATPEMAQKFVESRREELLDMQRALLGFDAIAREQQLAPSEAEIEAEFAGAVTQFTEQGQEYDREKLREQVLETVQANKVMDWLISNCTINVLPAKQL